MLVEEIFKVNNRAYNILFNEAAREAEKVMNNKKFDIKIFNNEILAGFLASVAFYFY